MTVQELPTMLSITALALSLIGMMIFVDGKPEGIELVWLALVVVVACTTQYISFKQQ